MRFAMTSAAVLILALCAGPAIALEPVSKCDALAAWAAGLETLPADFASFTALEPGQRSAVYRRLSNPQRAALWHEQLGRELARDGWNEAQRALIAESRAFANAENLAAAESGSGSAFESVRAATAGLEARVKQAFPRAAALRVFYALGPETSAPAGPGWGRDCDCTEGYVELCGPIGVEECVYGFCHDPRFCGWMWMYVCDASCRSV